MDSSSQIVRLTDADNVAVARKPIPEGTEFHFDGGTLRLPRGVAMGHKFALVPIKEGDAIRKYGQVIGFAGRAILPGEHVHVHNLKTKRW